MVHCTVNSFFNNKLYTLMFWLKVTSTCSHSFFLDRNQISCVSVMGCSWSVGCRRQWLCVTWCNRLRWGTRVASTTLPMVTSWYDTKFRSCQVRKNYEYFDYCCHVLYLNGTDFNCLYFAACVEVSKCINKCVRHVIACSISHIEI